MQNHGLIFQTGSVSVVTEEGSIGAVQAPFFEYLFLKQIIRTLAQPRQKNERHEQIGICELILDDTKCAVVFWRGMAGVWPTEIMALMECVGELRVRGQRGGTQPDALWQQLLFDGSCKLLCTHDKCGVGHAGELDHTGNPAGKIMPFLGVHAVFWLQLKLVLQIHHGDLGVLGENADIDGVDDILPVFIRIRG